MKTLQHGDQSKQVTLRLEFPGDTGNNETLVALFAPVITLQYFLSRLGHCGALLPGTRPASHAKCNLRNFNLFL